MSSTVSWHFEKHTKNDVNGLQKHNERTAKSHKNERINPDKSYLNSESFVDHKFSGMTYQQRIDQMLNKNYRGKRAPRKDAIVDVQHTLQFGGDEINNLPLAEKQKVMVSATNFLVDKLGGYDNVIGLNIHRDETNDHVHMDTLPLTSDGRLSAKEIYSRQFMKETQSELLEYLQVEYPELDFVRADKAGRGFENGRSQADFERLSDEKRKHDEEYQEREKTLKTAENDLKRQMVDSLELLEPEFMIESSVYVENKLTESPTEEYFAFLDEFGTEPMPINTRQGWQQVYEWLHIDEIKQAIEQAKQYVTDFIVNKADELIRREDELVEKENDLSVRSDLVDEKAIHAVSVLTEQPETQVKEVVSGYDDETKSHYFELELDMGLKNQEKRKDRLDKMAVEQFKTKEQLADTVIDLGYLGRDWRDSLIENNGLKAVNNKTQEHVNKPFKELLPEAIHKASYQQLNAVMERTRRFNGKDKGMSR